MNGIEHVGDLRAFEAVARMGSLSAAARDIGMPLSVLSKRLARLERVLGQRLAERSTRILRLTPAGEAFLDRCRRALHAFDALADGADTPFKGRIRVSGSVAFVQRRLVPALPDFLDANPGTTVELLSTNSLIDLVREGVDLTFRQLDVGVEAGGDHVAPDGHVLVASPEYLERHGTPEKPEHLTDHRCLTVGPPAPRSWRLRHRGKVVEVPIRSTICGSDGEPAHAAALAHGGIAMKSRWDVLEDIASGRLVRILPEWGTGSREIRAIMPSDHRPRIVVRLLRHVKDRLGKEMAAHPFMFLE